MKFLLTSAGIKNQQLTDALLNLLGKPASSAATIFVPTAAYAPLPAEVEDENDKSWLTANIDQLKALDFKSFEVIDIATAPIDSWKQKFINADLISFGGGSETYLAQVLNETGLTSMIRGFTDKTYMGISAGSMVAGKFLNPELVSSLYPEEPFQWTEDKPLELLDLVFLPHLNSDYFTHVRKETLESMKDKFSTPTYSTDDDTALIIVDGKVEVVGPGESWVYLNK